jgi:ACS family D-galactonate transporter-like MFS transporter
MPATRVRYFVLFWMCLFAFLAYLHRNCIAVPSPLIQKDLHIDDETMAWVMGTFFWGYAIMQIPAGLLADRWGSRQSVFWFMVLGSLAMVFTGLLPGLAALMVCRLLMGMAQAGLFPAAVNSFTKWFPVRERGLPNGLLGSSMLLGGMIANATTGWVMQAADLTWQEIFLVFGIPGLVGAIGFFKWFRDRPQEHPWVNAGELTWIQQTSTVTPLPSLGSKEPNNIVQPSLWTWSMIVLLFFICGQQFFRAAGNLFYMTWFPRFLMEARGVTMERSGFLSSVPLLGMMVGSALGGRTMDWIFQKTGSQLLSRHGLAMVSMALSATFLVLPYWFDLPLAAYTVTIDLGGKNVATVFSIMNMAGNIGAALAPVLVIQWRNWLGWNAVLFLQAGFFVGALLCWMAMCVPKNQARIMQG